MANHYHYSDRWLFAFQYNKCVAILVSKCCISRASTLNRLIDNQFPNEERRRECLEFTAWIKWYSLKCNKKN